MNHAEARRIVYSLAGIAVLGSLATQLIVPALPVIAQDLGAGTAATQRIISVYLVGLAVGQLICGPLADKVGRRPVVLGGLLLFALGSIAAAAAFSLPALLAARFLQALGGAAGIITSRVMVGDIFPAKEAAVRQATMMSVILLSPTIAPVIGGLLTQWFGWRPLFGILGIVALVAATIALFRMTESRSPHAPSVSGLTHSYTILARNRQFVGSAVAVAGGSAALYMFLAAAPFILAHDHGLGPRDIGLCLLLVAIASIAGTKLVGPIDRRGNGLVTGLLMSLAGAFAMTAIAFAEADSLAAFMLPLALVGFGTGVLGPSGFAQIVHSQTGLEGTAASLAGALQMFLSALASGVIGQVNAMGLALAVLLSIGVATVAAWIGRPERLI